MAGFEFGIIGKIKEFFVSEIELNRTAKTIQLLFLRQTHDYSIFRTEETRELNLVTLPTDVNNKKPILRVAMLASKQKAPENRWFLTLYRTFAEEEKITLSEEQLNCALKDQLCQQCPRCALFGAVSTRAGRGERYNIKHRIEYSTAYSIEGYEDIAEMITFNAVDSRSQSTGQALGYSENVQPMVHFPSIVSLNSVTAYEFVAVLRAILSCKSYGAESRVKGDMMNHLVGISVGMEEIITPLEFLLEATTYKEKMLEEPREKTYEILNKYKNYSMFPDRVIVLKANEITALVDQITNEIKIDKEFIENLYDNARKLNEKLSSIST